MGTLLICLGCLSDHIDIDYIDIRITANLIGSYYTLYKCNNNTKETMIGDGYVKITITKNHPELRKQINHSSSSPQPIPLPSPTAPTSPAAVSPACAVPWRAGALRGTRPMTFRPWRWLPGQSWGFEI